MGILDDAIREHLDLKKAHGAPEDEIRRKEAEAFGPTRQPAPAAPEDATQMLRRDDVGDELYADPAVHPDPSAVVHEQAPAFHPEADATVQPRDVDALQPDPHDHAHHAGSDPAWGEDTEFFSEPAAGGDAGDAPPAAEAGAGTLESAGPTEPGPPGPAEHHHDDPHPALHDHDAFHAEEHAPEPVHGHRAGTPAAPPDAPLDPAPVEDPPVGDPPVESPEIDEPPPRQSPEHAEGDAEDVLEETPEFLQDAPEHDRLWFEQKPPRDFDFGE